MRRVLSGVSLSVAVLAVLVGGADQAMAGPLNPLDFTPVGPFPTAGGTYYFDTSGPNPTLSGPSGPALTGVYFNGIAVFDFNAVTVASDQVFVGQLPFSNVATPPLALLSRGDITINGTIDVSGSPGLGGPNLAPPVLGGPGGFGSDSGPGAGGGGSNSANVFGTGPYIAPGGGGFGGRGGNGGFVFFSRGEPTIINPFSGASGGGSYGNLAISLQGGSGGGSASGGRGGSSSGGGGGGAIEVGAVGGITVNGSILANGGGGVGSGSGGGIFLHGDSVALLGVLSAQGGSTTGNGGGGGGGQILIQAGPGGITGNLDGISVSGGSGSNLLPFSETFSAAGGPGVITLTGTVVPEPASMVLLGIGLLGVLGCARYAGRRRPPESDVPRSCLERSGRPTPVEWPT